MLKNKKDVLVLGEEPTQELDGTTVTTKVKCYINFIEWKKTNFVIQWT